jgi:hypothetical protein
MKNCAFLLPLLLLLSSCGFKAGGPDAEDQKPKTEQKKAASNEADGSLHLDREAQTRAQLKTAALAVRMVGSNVVAYGQLEEDPSYSYVVRASAPGVLHANPGVLWPIVGQNLKAGTVFGVLRPRLAPAERIALLQQLATAQADQSASTAAVSAARTAYERAKLLNADRKNFSDKALQEADARLRSEQARLDAAARTVQVLQTSLDPPESPAGQNAAVGQRLVAGRAGDVVEVLAQPEESVEQGVEIIRLTRLDKLLARIDIPVGTPLAANLKEAAIVPSGYENQPPIRCIRLGFAPVANPNVQATSILFRLQKSRFGLRPGMGVTAYLPVPGNSRDALVIPQAAVVRYGGRSFVYLQPGSDKFVRREIPIDEPTADGYVVSAGFAAGDRVVVVGAETLLSEEFKSKLQADQD